LDTKGFHTRNTIFWKKPRVVRSRRRLRGPRTKGPIRENPSLVSPQEGRKIFYQKKASNFFPQRFKGPQFRIKGFGQHFLAIGTSGLTFPEPLTGIFQEHFLIFQLAFGNIQLLSPLNFQKGPFIGLWEVWLRLAWYTLLVGV